jgi:hypothetical protein
MQTPLADPSTDRGPLRRRRRAAGPNRRGERGEGVISTAIAVLIVAFLGIALWTGFDSMMNSATERTRDQVEQIGG